MWELESVCVCVYVRVSYVVQLMTLASSNNLWSHLLNWL